MYGYEAYRLLFSAVDKRCLANSLLSDGDTKQTLEGRARHYCIAIENPNAEAIRLVREALTRCEHPGLLPVERRFLEGAAVEREPLIEAARIGVGSSLIRCDVEWIQHAYDEAAHVEPD